METKILVMVKETSAFKKREKVNERGRKKWRETVTLGP